MSPYCLFNGTKINYKKSLALPFGDYCEVFDGSDNTSKSHSLPCIALYPCNNSTGSWQFTIRRLTWCCMVTMQVVLNKTNSMLTMAPQDEAAVPEIQEAPYVEPAPEVQNMMEPALTEHIEEVDVCQPSNEENTAQSNTQEAIVPVQKSAQIAGGIPPCSNMC
jgi:hypothetical protein